MVESVMDLLLFTLAFCRTVTGCLFFASLVGKLRNLSGFQQTVQHFRLLPSSLTKGAAYLVLSGEGIIVLCMMYGGIALLPGFLLATGALLLFSIALVSVLKRKMRLACNCFGVSAKTIGRADIWRNAGFLLCTWGGIATALLVSKDQASLVLADWLMVGGGAVIFTLIWSQLGEIVLLLSNPGTGEKE
jgi:hypothetical protein